MKSSNLQIIKFSNQLLAPVTVLWSPGYFLNSAHKSVILLRLKRIMTTYPHLQIFKSVHLQISSSGTVLEELTGQKIIFCWFIIVSVYVCVEASPGLIRNSFGFRSTLLRLSFGVKAFGTLLTRTNPGQNPKQYRSWPGVGPVLVPACAWVLPWLSLVCNECSASFLHYSGIVTVLLMYCVRHHFLL